MLVDLDTLDVVIRQAKACSREDHKHTDSCLCFDCATKSPPADHKRTSIGDKDEQDDDVSVDPVEDEEFMTDDGYELPDHQKACRKDGAEMKGNTDTICASLDPVPFARRGAVLETAIGRSADIEV